MLRPQTSRAGLVGRARELDDLAVAFRAAVAGEPRVVFIDGVPGMGKTVLLDAFAATLDPAGVMRLACDPFETELAFGVAGIVLAEWQDAAVSPVAVGQRLLAWMGDLEDAATSGAAVLLLDDVQWMDPESVNALRFAVRRLRADRVLVVLARRPSAGDDPWASLLANPALTTARTLSPWTVADVLTVATDRFAQHLTAAEADQLVAESGGLPLLVAAWLADLSSGAAPESAGITADAGERLLRSLDPQSRRLVAALAVLAEAATLVELGAVADVGDPSLALTGALATHAIARDSATGKVGFSHALYQGSVYVSIDAVTRRDLHRRAASCTSGDRSLLHRVAAADRPDPHLVTDLETAARGHFRDDRHARAATLLLAARTVSADPDTRDRLLLSALVYRLQAQDLPGALALRVEAENTEPSALRSFALGRLMRMTARVPEATGLLSEAIARAEAEHLHELVTRASIELAALHASLNDGPATVAAADRALAEGLAEYAGDAMVLRSFGLWSSGDSGAALEQLADNRVPVDTGSTRATQLTARGMICLFTGDLQRSAHDLDAAAQLARTARPTAILDRLYITRCSTRHALGDWDGASVDAATARTLAEAGDLPWTAAAAYAVSVYVPAGRGQIDVAEEHLERAWAAQRRMPSFQASSMVSTAALRVQRARQDWEGMLGLLASLRQPEMFDRLLALRTFRRTMITSIEVQIRLGRLDVATDELAMYDTLLAKFPGGLGPTRMGFLHGQLAVARNDPHDARAWYAQDLVDPRLIEQPFIHATTLCHAGSLERALGNRRDAIDRLRQARDIALTLRAIPLITWCDAELEATGLHQSSPDPLALTPREEDVAALVARGLTNAEVATELFVTIKTVEYHLRNIYAKLGITGRKALRLTFSAPQR